MFGFVFLKAKKTLKNKNSGHNQGQVKSLLDSSRMLIKIQIPRSYIEPTQNQHIRMCFLTGFPGYSAAR